jgi:hypothetical protein
MERRLSWLLAFLLFPLISSLNAQIATNHVLDLDGTNSAVELPPNIFNGFQQATIETWVKFRDLTGSRFYSYGGFQNDLCVGRVGPSRDLHVFVNPSNQFAGAVAVGLIQTDVWFHVAAVLGPGGMELLVNGVLAGTNASPACFSSLGSGGVNFLGHMNGRPGAAPIYFHGQPAEFRVWKTRRTPREIRADMFRRLTGMEPGLAGSWSFDSVSNGVVKDSGPNGFAGKLMGGAKVVPAQFPADPVAAPLDRVLDLDGTNACVVLPSGLITNVVVTIEGWFKWRRFNAYSRLFNFYGERVQFGLLNRATTGALYFEWPERDAAGRIAHYATVEVPPCWPPMNGAMWPPSCARSRPNSFSTACSFRRKKSGSITRPPSSRSTPTILAAPRQSPSGSPEQIQTSTAR